MQDQLKYFSESRGRIRQSLFFSHLIGLCLPVGFYIDDNCYSYKSYETTYMIRLQYIHTEDTYSLIANWSNAELDLV